MTRRLDVIAAVAALVQATFPTAEVLCLDNEAEMPNRIGDSGMVIVREGEPGDPQIDLSPPTYNYDHLIPVQVIARGDGVLSAKQVVDQLVGLLSPVIAANRTLGGLVDYLEGTAPATGAIYSKGVEIGHGAEIPLTASYSTPDPL